MRTPGFVTGPSTKKFPLSSCSIKAHQGSIAMSLEADRWELCEVFQAPSHLHQQPMEQAVSHKRWRAFVRSVPTFGVEVSATYLLRRIQLHEMRNCLLWLPFDGCPIGLPSVDLAAGIFAASLLRCIFLLCPQLLREGKVPFSPKILLTKSSAAQRFGSLMVITAVLSLSNPPGSLTGPQQVRNDACSYNEFRSTHRRLAL